MQSTSRRVTNLGLRTSVNEVSPNASRRQPIRLFLTAYSELVRFDRYLTRSDFAGLYHTVRRCPLVDAVTGPDAVSQICQVVDLACIWYWKEVLCLQRSAATTCLLRRYGIPARMVLGVQQTPFRAHAWVETNHQVVNDKPYIGDLYRVIDIC